MSEYWVSKKKYYCKFCNIYIADDAPSRQQHENGLRHKGNKERFVRGLYKAGEKRKKDLEEEKHEMIRVEQAARAAFANDISTGHARQSEAAAGPSTSKDASKPPPKPSNPYANYSTAASLGYTDPDAERLAAEAERHRMEGVVGDWEYVAPSQDLAATASSIVEAPEKREAEQPVDDERHFKIRKKTLDVGLGNIYDPGLIRVKKKEASPPPPNPLLAPATNQATLGLPAATNVPKWTKVQWKKAGDEEVGSSQEPPEDHTEPELPNEEPMKTEESIDTVKTESATNLVKIEESTPAPPTGLFKKRKRPGMRS
ncbi:hypothetical protein PC9H_007538 [Pleurotus ostreatus]|uniref:Matrin-type domain-containing protein n=1 Tax=Pleurotus ostreatus TaxID=5322 RepID=A0A8H6ZRA3_PLEOS|nr:uncharacterized protein PC9H_007538 [Pleurotus ostreatus]KAF7428317.1 hypothetical protein PC9H_007538 [Pleurotus ostreatus]KAJ8696424.1 hypothetical protein PTI98_006296 [Pleurotus ostreatus]